MAKERIDTYPEAARVIALWLDEFCDKSLRYPEMIAEAARKAAKEIELLRSETSQQKIQTDAFCQCERPEKRPYMPLVGQFCIKCGKRTD